MIMMEYTLTENENIENVPNLCEDEENKQKGEVACVK